MNRLSSFGIVLALAFSAVTCQSGDSGGVTDTNTNWLMSCDSDGECRGGLCLCGRCTARCVDDADCADYGEEAVCGEAAASCVEGSVCVRAGTNSNGSSDVEPSAASAPSDEDPSSEDVSGGPETVSSAQPPMVPNNSVGPGMPVNTVTVPSNNGVEFGVGGSFVTGAAGFGEPSNGGSSNAGASNLGAAASGGTLGTNGGASNAGSSGAGASSAGASNGGSSGVGGAVEGSAGATNGGSSGAGAGGAGTGSGSNGGGASSVGGSGGAPACHVEGEVCLERTGPAGEVTAFDEPCCMGQSCSACVTSDGVETCRCENAARECAAVCDVYEPYSFGWCSPEQGFVTEDYPIEWVCSGDLPVDQLESQCVGLATGAQRWCCPETFDAVCE